MPIDADRMYLSVYTTMIMAFPVNIVQLSIKYRRNISVCRDVGDYDISSKYFSTHYKMLMDTVFVGINVGDCGISSKYFTTLSKIATNVFRL